MTEKLKELSAEFPRPDIHWRAQTLTKNKDKALALAYLDARDVMDRLDDVLSPAGWQDEYVETVKGRVICRIGIILPDVGWVWKSDGAGDTAVEGEKGGISDAFKRAAVKWGIGRYLYRMNSVWCPCDVGNNGKWRKWTDDPWNHVRGGSQPAPSKPEPPKEPEQARAQVRDSMKHYLSQQRTPEDLDKARDNDNFKSAYRNLPEPMKLEIQAHGKSLKAKMEGTQ